MFKEKFFTAPEVRKADAERLNTLYNLPAKENVVAKCFQISLVLEDIFVITQDLLSIKFDCFTEIETSNIHAVGLAEYWSILQDALKTFRENFDLCDLNTAQIERNSLICNDFTEAVMRLHSANCLAKDALQCIFAATEEKITGLVLMGNFLPFYTIN